MKRRNFLRSTKQKLYTERRFKNPDAKRVISIKWRLIIGFVVFLFTLLSLPFILSYAPAFTISTINIEGLSSVPKGEIYDIIANQMDERPYRVFTQKSSFYFDEEQLATTLMETYDFKHLQIDVDRTNLQIQAEERIVQIIWISGTAHYFVDLDGRAMHPLSETEIVEIQSRLNDQEFINEDDSYRPLHKYIPVIVDLSNSSIEDGQDIVSDEFINSIVLLDETLRERFVEPVKYEVDEQASDTFKLISSLNVPVIFKADGTIEEQLENLDVILQQTENPQEFEYIDLRFGNHVFVK